ncbi:hypothetical protein BDY19DRAFT_369021 [Irpex rosettiformis]|uniref:Uncharacterized protein n=1 Tax=Irpex rosettiformis TaxID=378272 RepID=A0ACB8TVX9_9APHY|nr:hypothetical protein BDY19DRAFT_369021 [Irpex rosettiformis]
MEFTSNAENSASLPVANWGLRDYWHNGMHIPHPQLGWFPLSVKGGVICHWSMTSPHDYYQFLKDGYHSDYEFDQARGRLPCRMHLCLVCKSIFDAGYNTTVSHCDSITHRNRLTEVLDLDGPLQSGMSASSPENRLALQLESIGIDKSQSLYNEIPKAAFRDQRPSFSPSHSPSSSTSSNTSAASTPSVDLSSMFTKALRVSPDSETEYNNLLRAMKFMGLK